MASFIGHVREISFGMYWPENARVLAHFSHPHPRCRSHLGFTAQHVGHDVKMISAHRPQPTQISAPKASPVGRYHLYVMADVLGREAQV